MRLKQNHGGYHSSGLWQKYQSPKIVERPIKAKKKKDDKLCTNGKGHNWHRYQCMTWSDEEWKYVEPHEHIKCFECGKKKSPKTAKSLNLPLHAWIKQHNGGYDVVQVQANGQWLPISRYQFHPDKYWCDECGYYH